MFCYSVLGDRTAALKQYDACKRALREELAVEPSKETQALYESIKQKTETSAPAARLTNLPRPLTSFIGRTQQVQSLKRLLEQGSLVTLTGAGGSGKTRLAIEAGRELLSAYPEGVWWVDLSALS